MSDPLAPLQAAIRAALKTDPGVQAAMGAVNPKVYDIPPTNGVPPYLVIGSDTATPVAAEGFDGAQAACTIHVWSLTDPPGLAECKAIGAAVRAALAQPLAIAGYRLDFDPTVGDSRYLVDVDGRSAHGVIAVGWTASPV